MINQYLKVAFRKLLKHKVNLAINVAGLSIGLAVSAIILLHVRYEYSYDKFFANAENTYRVRYDRYQNGSLVFQKATSVFAIGPLIKNVIPEVKNYARAGIEQVLLFRDEAKFNDQPVFWADSTFLNVIPVKMLRGNINTALVRPYTMVLSSSSAKKFFGNEDPIDKIVYLNEHLPFTVTGIFEDLPENSHFIFKTIVSLSTGNVLWPGWGSNNIGWGGEDWLYTYITLEKGADPKLVEQKIAKIVEKLLPDDFKRDNVLPKFYLQRITDIHLNSNFENEITSNASKRNIYFMLLIGLIILVIAWVNFVNISIAEASEKAREIGVRKIIGAHRGTLISQILTEAFLINLIGFIIAIQIISFVLPLYSSIIDKPLTNFLYTHLFYYGIFFLVVIAGTLLSGFYPAFVISAFNPLKVLKGSIFEGKEKNSFKKALVIIQLVATTVLIVSVLVIYKQINFIQSKELGFNKECVAVIPAPRSLNMDTTKYMKYQIFKNRLLTNNSIEAVTCTYFVPGMEQVSDSRFIAFDNKPFDEIRLKNYLVDNDFLKVYKVNLVAGTNFSEIRQANRNNIIINESTLALLGLKYPGEAIGHIVTTANNQKRTIIGVYSDFHQESLHSKIKPAVYFYGYPPNFGNYSVRINPKRKIETLDFIKSEWTKIYPYDACDYFFEDSYIDGLYKQDLHFGQLIIIFTVLSVFIACLGLLGLIMIIAAENNKSIGIRKVSGATIAEIVFMIMKSFFSWIAIAFVIAVPLAYLLMQKWLENFAYRTKISWWIFVTAGLIVLLITIATVIWQTWRAATRNPVEALRYE
jgi:putative ABC transport system permease protein